MAVRMVLLDMEDCFQFSSFIINLTVLISVLLLLHLCCFKLQHSETIVYHFLSSEITAAVLCHAGVLTSFQIPLCVYIGDGDCHLKWASVLSGMQASRSSL